jgi:outer membrane receptor for monomeric catechols
MKRTFLQRFLVAFSLTLVLTATGVAQRGTGTIVGRVVDKEGAVLPGAQVQLEPKVVSVATNGQGEYTIPGVVAGEYTLKISYVGFQDFTTKVTVKSGTVSRGDATLQVAGGSQEVTVVADAQGVAEAINEQRTSDNIVDVMPAGVIQSLPNANIADVVGRVPGVSLERDEGEGKYVQIRGTEPRLNNTTVDGIEVPAPEDNVRQVKLDTIPSGIVESVEVNKTPSVEL